MENELQKQSEDIIGRILEKGNQVRKKRLGQGIGDLVRNNEKEIKNIFDDNDSVVLQEINDRLIRIEQRFDLVLELLSGYMQGKKRNR